MLKSNQNPIVVGVSAIKYARPTAGGARARSSRQQDGFNRPSKLKPPGLSPWQRCWAHIRSLCSLLPSW